MASAELSRRVEKVVGYPPLVEMDDRQRRDFHDAPLDANSFEDPPGLPYGFGPAVGTRSGQPCGSGLPSEGCTRTQPLPEKPS
jgi:hypothetical protein